MTRTVCDGGSCPQATQTLIPSRNQMMMTLMRNRTLYMTLLGTAVSVDVSLL
jgi:hypothetical protein